MSSIIFNNSSLCILLGSPAKQSCIIAFLTIFLFDGILYTRFGRFLCRRYFSSPAFNSSFALSEALGELFISTFTLSAAFGELLVSIFVNAFGELLVSIFVNAIGELLV